MGRAYDRDRSARKDAPSFTEYRAMKRAARSDVDEEFQLECEFIVVTIGELGLRPGEVTHMTEEWVDREHGKIRIPPHDPCYKGQDGGRCGYCKKQAEQAAEYDNPTTFEEALENMWSPKLKASARTIPFKWNPSILELYDRFFSVNDGYPKSRVSINRNVSRVAEATEVFDDTSEVYPHALRGHAGRFHASQGVRAHTLRKLMGWERVDSAMDYIEMEAKDIETELERVYNNNPLTIGY